MAKRTPASPASPRKRAPSKKGNGAADAPITAAPPEPSEEDIRHRAYHRYLERGGHHGADLDDWVEAEKDLKSSRHN